MGKSIAFNWNYRLVVELIPHQYVHTNAVSTLRLMVSCHPVIVL